MSDDLWIVFGNKDVGPDFVSRIRESAMEHAAECAEIAPDLGPWTVRQYVAVERAERAEAERDALRALLVSVPTYLASLEARITHSCPLKDGAATLRNAINAALREGK